MNDSSSNRNYSPEAHYDRVTKAWGLLLGEELHYGVFDVGDEDLATATSALTTRMIDEAQLAQGQRVLDVGCGTGSPACRLARDYAVEVVGISTSEVGVTAARRRAEAAGLNRATFEVRDGTANGFPTASFDRVWVMESSHLMPNRAKLMSECARVLRPGGRVVLCDLIRRREIPFAELRRRRRDFGVLRAAFGAARLDLLADYSSEAGAAGLVDVSILDLTAATVPTFDRWQSNLDEHRADVTALLGAAGTAEFEQSIAILRTFWHDGTLGYGLFSATDPSS